MIPRTDLWEEQRTSITGCQCEPPRTCFLCRSGNFQICHWVRRPLFARHAQMIGERQDKPNGQQIQEIKIGRYHYILIREEFSDMLQVRPIHPAHKYAIISEGLMEQMKKDLHTCGSWSQTVDIHYSKPPATTSSSNNYDDLDIDELTIDR